MKYFLNKAVYEFLFVHSKNVASTSTISSEVF